jgi:superfamily I DNA/RNA helicase
MLLDVQPEGDSLVLHLGDKDGQVLYRPRRFLSFSNTESIRQHAQSLIGSMVVTETSNPTRNPREKWWVSVRLHIQSQSSVDAPREQHNVAVPSEQGKTCELLGLGSPQAALSSASTVRLGFDHVHKIYGPPGTGKTSRLLELVEQALRNDVRPADIGFFSYTNKATDEARQRMVRKFPQFDIEQNFPYFQTMHSLAYQSLRTRVDVISEQQARDFSGEVLIERPLMREGDESSRVIRVKHPVLDASSTARAKKMPLKRYLEDLPESQRWPIHKWRGRPRHEWDWRPLDGRDIQACVDYDDRYEAHKRMLGVIDYTDMIERALRDDAALPALQLLLIDEAQDLTPLQWDLARVLIGRAERCHVAGDDDQAICEPFGASAKEFVELPVGTDNELVLQTSRRVPAAVHEALGPLIQRLSARFPYRKAKTWHPKDGTLSGKVSQFTDVGAFLESGILTKHVAQSRAALLMFATNATLQMVSALLKARGVSHFAAHERVGNGDPVVRLLTVWGAKGGEAPLAALIVESKMDRKMLDGDPRLEYVAHTRAQEEYCLVGLEWSAAAASQPRMSAPALVAPEAPTNSGGLSPQALELLKQKFGRSGR